MKKALVLAGGGTRGAYQAGAIKAYRQFGKGDWNIVVGTSVGSLNAALVVQKDYDVLDSLYLHLRSDQIIRGIVPTQIDLNVLMNQTQQLGKEMVQYVREKGVDITPFVETVHTLYRPEAFFASDTDFGCMVATHLDHSAVYITKKEMKEHGEDWLIASASCYPAFPVKTIEGKDYVDGGYYDNCAIDFALQLGAEELLVLDLNNEPNHPEMVERSNILYQFPHTDLGDFLQFDHEVLCRLYQKGYQDACKKLGIFSGEKYTFEKMELPYFFSQWYLSLERLETQLYRNVALIRSPSLITDQLKQNLHRQSLTDEMYFFGMVDQVMDLLGMEDTKVYRFTDVEQKIRQTFEEARKENFRYAPSLSVKEMGEYVKTLDTKGIVRRLVHQKYYPEHVFFSTTVTWTLHPYEKALADFIYYWMGE